MILLLLTLKLQQCTARVHGLHQGNHSSASDIRNGTTVVVVSWPASAETVFAVTGWLLVHHVYAIYTIPLQYRVWSLGYDRRVPVI